VYLLTVVKFLSSYFYDYNLITYERWAGHIARMEAMGIYYKILVGKPEGKRPLRRTRRRWEDNIRIDIREIGWESLDRIRLAQDSDQWRAVVYTR
jgi:hypothetical protein